MDDSKELANFRQNWLKELEGGKRDVFRLVHSAITVTTGLGTSAGPSNNTVDQNSASKSNTDHEDTEASPSVKGYENWSGVEEARKRPNKFPSFLLAEDLLKGGEMQGPFAKKLRSDDSKVPVIPKKNEYLDILLKDLVGLKDILYVKPIYLYF